MMNSATRVRVSHCVQVSKLLQLLLLMLQLMTMLMMLLSTTTVNCAAEHCKLVCEEFNASVTS